MDFVKTTYALDFDLNLLISVITKERTWTNGFRLMTDQVLYDNWKGD